MEQFAYLQVLKFITAAAAAAAAGGGGGVVVVVVFLFVVVVFAWAYYPDSCKLLRFSLPLEPDPCRQKNAGNMPGLFASLSSS